MTSLDNTAELKFREYIMDSIMYHADIVTGQGHYHDPNFRPGQAYVNVLGDYLPRSALEEVLSVADPFYLDNRLGDFLDAVYAKFCERWPHTG